ncbi:MAG: DUF104 domain-containing protein [Candidatus Methanospirare jalkutatii]|nr:DUF104 domain-containing protein [Candidatus Methanospirare jalkutatii]
MKEVEAVYEKGVLKPLERLGFERRRAGEGGNKETGEGEGFREV